MTTPEAQRLTAFYIASATQTKDFNRRCKPISHQVEVAALQNFANQDIDEAFEKIIDIINAGAAHWTVLNLASVCERDDINESEFIDYIKDIIRAGGTKRTRLYIVDVNQIVTPAARETFHKFEVHFVNDEKEIGVPFNQIQDQKSYELAKVGEESEIFQGVSLAGRNEAEEEADPNANIIPGALPSTPGSIEKHTYDPFDLRRGYLDEDADDPFARRSDANSGRASETSSTVEDPFAGRTMQSQTADPFAQMPMGNANDPFADAAQTMPAAVELSQFSSGADDPLGGLSFDDLYDPKNRDIDDPFADAANRPGGVGSGSRHDDPFGISADDSAAVPRHGNPFAHLEVIEENDGFPSGSSSEMGADTRRGGNALFDDVGTSPAPRSRDTGAWDELSPRGEHRGGYDMPGDRGGYPAGSGQLASYDIPDGEKLTVEDLLYKFGGMLDESEYKKLASMLDPTWNYELEAADGIGLNGKKLGGKKLGGKLSYVDPATLAESEYIPEMERRYGYYTEPEEPKLIVVQSCKGGSGKLIGNSCPIPTLSKTGKYSMKTVGKIRPGDYVYNRLGNPVKVLEIHPSPEPVEIYRITLKDGRTIDVSGDHLWNVMSRESDKSETHHRKVVSTKEMLDEGLLKNEGRGKQEYRWKIPMNHAIEHPEADLPIPPYTLGLLLGDGYLAPHIPKISSEDVEIIKMMEEDLGGDYIVEKEDPGDLSKGESLFKSNCSWNIRHKQSRELEEGNAHCNPLADQLAALGLNVAAEHKYIPDIYKSASIAQRKALLQGLMDSDGAVCKGCFSFFTTNKRLCDDFVELVRGLGYVCSVRHDNRPGKYKSDGGFNVDIQTDDETIFRLQRKQDDYLACRPQQTNVDPIPERTSPMLYDAANTPADTVISGDHDLPIAPYLAGILALRENQRSKAISLSCADNHMALRVVESLPAEIILEPQPHPRCRNRYILRDADGTDGCDEKIRNTVMELFTTNSPANDTDTPLDRYNPETDFNIPPAYRYGSPEARLAFLQGVMDYAGSFSSQCFPCICCKSPEMLSQLQEFIASLGFATQLGDTKQDENCIIIRTLDTDLFGTENRREDMLNHTNAAYREDGTLVSVENDYIAITNIERTGEYEDMTCLYVDDPEHLFQAGEGIVTHNTTVSVMIATQLNYYFNKAMMNRLSTVIRKRVLILSLNEFDDLPTHGIGYDAYVDEDNDTDGRNIVELLRRIDETNGNPIWDDISHCFVSTENNRVFYLPSLTTSEQLEGDNLNISAEDYKHALEVCSKFFDFIVVDSPDVFYQERNDLMTFVFSAADVICMIIEPDSHSTLNLLHFFNGLKTDTNKTTLNPDKCILVINKVVEDGNPYMVRPVDQIKVSEISKTLSKYFCRFVPIPFSQPRALGNVLFGSDAKVKEASAELADAILEVVAENDEREAKKKVSRRRK